MRQLRAVAHSTIFKAVLVRVSVAVTTDHDQKQPGKDRVSLSFPLSGHSKEGRVGNPARNLEAITEAEAKDACSYLA